MNAGFVIGAIVLAKSRIKTYLARFLKIILLNNV